MKHTVISLIHYRTVKGHQIKPGDKLPVSRDSGGYIREPFSHVEVSVWSTGERVVLARSEVM